MLQPFDDELRDWDEWIARAGSGPLSSLRLARLRTRLARHIRIRTAENSPPEQIAALRERIAGIEATLRSR